MQTAYRVCLKQKSRYSRNKYTSLTESVHRKFLDNCPAYLSISNLTNFQPIFLPPNTTSVPQPLDQGAIRNLKAHYIGRIVRLLDVLTKG